MAFTILRLDELQHDGKTYDFEGQRYDNTDVSFIWVDLPPGDGVRLHKHAYKEIFIILEGSATYTVDSTTQVVEAEHIIIVPADTPHKFVNSGGTRLKQIDIHVSKHILTQWLED
jgi:mannose-6-phosphate isomerase-like protein (cupin superfamily)